MTRQWPQREHAGGEHCKVVETAQAVFGQDLSGVILWEFTCFPMSDDIAWDQLMDAVCAQGLGKLDEYLTAMQNHVHQQMREACHE